MQPPARVVVAQGSTTRETANSLVGGSARPAMSDPWAPLPEVIETDRLILRRFRAGDVDDVLAYARDPRWSRYLPGVPRPYTRADAEAFVASRVSDQWEAQATWAMQLNDGVAGGLGLTVESKHLRAALGYGLARPHWGKGLTTEAARAVIDAAYRTLPNLNRVYATCRRAQWRVAARHGEARHAARGAAARPPGPSRRDR